MFKVFNQRLAGYLMTQGFQLMSILPNHKARGFNVFCFENSPRLLKAIEDYKRTKGKGAN